MMTRWCAVCGRSETPYRRVEFHHVGSARYFLAGLDVCSVNRSQSGCHEILSKAQRRSGVLLDRRVEPGLLDGPWTLLMGWADLLALQERRSGNESALTAELAEQVGMQGGRLLSRIAPEAFARVGDGPGPNRRLAELRGLPSRAEVVPVPQDPEVRADQMVEVMRTLCEAFAEGFACEPDGGRWAGWLGVIGGNAVRLRSRIDATSESSREMAELVQLGAELLERLVDQLARANTDRDLIAMSPDAELVLRVGDVMLEGLAESLRVDESDAQPIIDEAVRRALRMLRA